MTKIERLSSREGILAAICVPPDDFSVAEFGGDEKWRETLLAVFNLLQTTTEPSIRVVIGAHTLFAEGSDAHLFAVATPTGHVIGKSLRRTLRRYATPKLRKTSVEGRVERAPEVQKLA